MDDTYMKLLPPDYRRFVEAAEALSGSSIVVEEVGGEHAGVSMSATSARIRLPSNGAMRDASLAHEVLHVRRFWLERSPMLTRIGGGYVPLDNQLEHLFIVPELSAHGLFDESRHSAESLALARRIQTVTDPNDRRLMAAVGWSVAQRTLASSAQISSIRAAFAATAEWSEAEAIEQGLPARELGKTVLLCYLLKKLPFLAGPTTSFQVLDAARGDVIDLSWPSICT